MKLYDRQTDRQTKRHYCLYVVSHPLTHPDNYPILHPITHPTESVLCPRGHNGQSLKLLRSSPGTIVSAHLNQIKKKNTEPKMAQN